MASIEQLHERFLAIAALLDQAAAEVRDLPLAPETHNVHHIGKALAEVFEVMRSIYAVRPDLTPHQLSDVSGQSEANRRLTRTLSEAYRLSGSKRLPDALALLASFAETEESDLHKDIALYEMQRLKERADP